MDGATEETGGAGQSTAHLREGRDEAGDAHDAGVGEQFGHLADAPDVLGAVAVAEAEVRVEPEAQVVAVERVRRHALAHQELLERERHCRLAGRRQTYEHSTAHTRDGRRVKSSRVTFCSRTDELMDGTRTGWVGVQNRTFAASFAKNTIRVRSCK